MKKLLTLILCLSLMTGLSSFATGCGGQGSKEQKYYDLVVATQEKLDILADDIYNNWYNAIYKDKFWGDIDIAISSAFSSNENSVEEIKTNDETIRSIYKDLKNSKIHDEIKTVMQAYNDYYEFVINVSGSFNSFSKDKEIKKKTLASAIKNLYAEM